MKIARTHDELYLTEDRKSKPKEYFKFIKEQADDFLKQFTAPKILDIGCATGEFLYYLRSCYPHASLEGTDILHELLGKAKKNVEDAIFFEADIYSGSNLPAPHQYDAVFMNGVHGIFDDYEKWLEHILQLVNFENKGRAFVFGLFNPEPIDVLVKVKRIENKENSWEPGWNCFSKKGIADYLFSKGYKTSFKDFQIDMDIDKKSEDALRSWTIKLEDGKRMIVHGSQIIHNLSLLVIEKL